MALGVRRHQVRQLRDGRYVSVGRIHSLRTADEYLRVLTQYGEWCVATFGEKRLPVSLKHADWGAAWLADLAAAEHTICFIARIRRKYQQPRGVPHDCSVRLTARRYPFSHSTG